MNKQRFIERIEIEEVAESMRATLELAPLPHHRKVELASEIATEQFGFTPKKSVILLAVKIADANWELTKATTLREIERTRS